MSKYFDELNTDKLSERLILLENYGHENHIPIVMKDTLMLIYVLIDTIKPKRILEIGSAIGYSSIAFASYSNAIIDTIERDDKMYDEAIMNIFDFKLENRINVFHTDALLIDVNSLSTYDIIFIDAAKAQNIKFFEKFSPLLNQDGIIITDNLLFHGVVENMEEASKNVRKMMEKIKAYNTYLKNLTNFSTIFIDVGDGISITRRKNI